MAFRLPMQLKIIGLVVSVVAAAVAALRRRLE
jgi:hypothetical protein